MRAARDAETAKKQSLETAERDLEKLKAEARALTEMLSTGMGEGWTPVIDLVHVTPGYEAALGAALGEDLNVPVDESAPMHWRSLPEIAVGARDASGRAIAVGTWCKRRRRSNVCLSQIGVVERDKGRALQSALAVGQCLVSREGDVWRWDGFTATAEAPTAAAVRLRQRNRLADLEGTIASAEAHAGEIRSVWQDAREARETAESTERTVRNGWRQAETEAAAARAALADAEKRHAQTAARTQSLNERHQIAECRRARGA